MNKLIINKSHSLKHILDISKKVQFLDILFPNELQINVEFLKLGKILSNNIKKEWMGNCHNFCNNKDLFIPSTKVERNSVGDIISFLNSTYYEENIKNYMNSVEKEFKTNFYQKFFQSNEINNYKLLLQNAEVLINTYIVNRSNSTEIFHKCQRQRKIWWKRFSANPGRFVISDRKTDDIGTDKIETVTIDAKFEFGNIIVENLILMPMNLVFNSIPHDDKNLIITSMPLGLATIETLLDAINSANFGELILHRKIAPYQCYICCHSQDQRNASEFCDLTEYLRKILNDSNISVFSTEKFDIKYNNTTLHTHFCKMDSVGIPYGIILNDESLSLGTMDFRDRDTSLLEKIHISDIPEYLIKIYNSY